MIKITYLDLSRIFRTGNTTLSLYVRARVLVQHPNHHHIIFLLLILYKLLPTIPTKVPAVPIDIVGFPTCTPGSTSGTLFTGLCECDNAASRGHMDLLIPFDFLIIICIILNDLCNIREFLCAQFVISDGSRLILYVFQLLIESVGVYDQVVMACYHGAVGRVA
jgi:hypothetical protein